MGRRKNTDTTPGTMPVYTNAPGVRRMLGITRQRFGDWLQLGLPEYSKDVYHVSSVVSWYKRETRIGNKANSNVEEEAKERLAIARAEKLESENRQRAGELIPIEEARAAFDATFTIMADALEYLGARLCNDLSGMDDPAEIQDLIWHEARNVRRLMADKLDFLEIEENEE